MVELSETGTISMTVIHVTQQLDSDTLQLPELKPLIGKKVEIMLSHFADHVERQIDHRAKAMIVTLDATPPTRPMPRSIRWVSAAEWLLEESD